MTREQHEEAKRLLEETAAALESGGLNEEQRAVLESQKAKLAGILLSRWLPVNKGGRICDGSAPAIGIALAARWKSGLGRLLAFHAHVFSSCCRRDGILFREACMKKAKVLAMHGKSTRTTSLKYALGH
jgi:hypothetical protein